MTNSLDNIYINFFRADLEPSLSVKSFAYHNDSLNFGIIIIMIALTGARTCGCVYIMCIRVSYGGRGGGETACKVQKKFTLLYKRTLKKYALHAEIEPQHVNILLQLYVCYYV